jgi:precorrin-2 dehydrogenase / sirohydrochlorin ferrochelatase
MACLDLDGRSALVVGGGNVALEKVRGLLECGASVTVVAPRLERELLELDIEILRRRYRESDLDGRFLVVAATSTPSLNRRVSCDADARELFCNVADVPDLCSFILPAVLRRDPIAVAVSTGGASPALAQRIRDDIDDLISAEHVDLALRLRELRPWVKQTYPTYDERKRFFAELVASEFL